MKIAVGSSNPVKLDAARDAFQRYYDDVDTVSVNVSSDVRPFPVGDKEIMTGAGNRAKAAKAAVPDCDFSVGIEGGAVHAEGRWFDRSYAVVMWEGKMGVGCSAGYEIDKDIQRRLTPESDASKKVIEDILGEEGIFRTEGVIGALSGGVLNRRSLLRDAVICALTRVVSPRFYGGSSSG
ncbi:inosine/xanthosine triphosphatase [Candidatus Bathyarchaeota archaeon]|nr:inosine/xanthosine triphosphatase [Candidatus Bathyarchaeota archaeon]